MYFDIRDNVLYHVHASEKKIVVPEGVEVIASDVFGIETYIIKEVVLPQSLVKICSHAFYVGLRSIRIPSNVRTIEPDAFSDMENLEKIEVDEANPFFSDCGCNVLLEKSTGRLILAAHGASIPAETKIIEAKAFAECVDMKEIVIPEGVVSVAGHAFSACSGARFIRIPDSLTELHPSALPHSGELQKIEVGSGNPVLSVMGNILVDTRSKTLLLAAQNPTVPEDAEAIAAYAFAGRRELTMLKLPYGLQSIGAGAFSGCCNLKQVLIPDTVSSIGDRAFSGCTSLLEICLPEALVSLSAEVFAGCANLCGVGFPNLLQSIGDRAFHRCERLMVLRLPQGLLRVGKEAFEGCTGLIHVTFPDCLTEIEEHAFTGCSRLSQIELPAGLETIGIAAFRDCTSLSELTVPGNVKQICNAAFRDCSNLRNLKLQEGLQTLGSYAFAGCPVGEVALPASLTEVGSEVFYFEGPVPEKPEENKSYWKYAVGAILAAAILYFIFR